MNSILMVQDIGGGTGRNSRITYTVPSGQRRDIRHQYVESDQLELSANLGTYTLTVVDTANTAPTGRPAISGTAQVGKVLTAGTTTITDADGLTSPNFIYQWVRVDGGTETDIASATSSTYTPVAGGRGQEDQGEGVLHRRRRLRRGPAHQRRDRGGAGAGVQRGGRERGGGGRPSSSWCPCPWR